MGSDHSPILNTDLGLNPLELKAPQSGSQAPFLLSIGSSRTLCRPCVYLWQAGAACFSPHHEAIRPLILNGTDRGVHSEPSAAHSPSSSSRLSLRRRLIDISCSLRLPFKAQMTHLPNTPYQPNTLSHLNWPLNVILSFFLFFFRFFFFPLLLLFPPLVMSLVKMAYSVGGTSRKS